MAEANAAAEADPSVLRVSIDSKATVTVGNLSSGGQDRRHQAPKADDHAMAWPQGLTPFGMLNLHTDEVAISLGESAETPDVMVDGLDRWWEDHRPKPPKVTTLAINLDGGRATRSDRTQVIKRMVTLA